MNTSSVVHLDLGERAYDIVIGQNQLSGLGPHVAALHSGRKAVVITNTVVGPLYGAQVEASLRGAGFEVGTITIGDGETIKHLETVSGIYDQLLERFRADRQTLLVALGGGVVGDITGFVAATYYRGVPFIQVPTTILAAVDSSVGGKTGVNHPLGKNLIGAFYQPILVWADLAVFQTLEPRERSAGLAEVVKYGLIRDPALFDLLEDRAEAIAALDLEQMARIVADSCRIKAQVVGEDEREGGVRALLNLGHTAGHAVEALTGYSQYRHGEAVAIGHCVAALISRNRGWLSDEAYNRIAPLLRRLNLPVELPDFSVEAYLQAMGRDKKWIGGRARWVLLRGIGQGVIADDVATEEVVAALVALGASE